MLIYKRKCDPGTDWGYAKDPGGTVGKILDSTIKPGGEKALIQDPGGGGWNK